MPSRADWARVGFPGEPGAYSEEAALAILPAAVTVGRIVRHQLADARAQEAGERVERVDDLRRALIATGLVASAEVKLVPAADGRTVDLAVNLQPAPMHTIAGELGYGTGEGVRAEASWQHRNFFNPEGALTVRGVAGTKEQLAALKNYNVAVREAGLETCVGGILNLGETREQRVEIERRSLPRVELFPPGDGRHARAVHTMHGARASARTRRQSS